MRTWSRTRVHGRAHFEIAARIAAEFPIMTAVRGRGLFIAFDLPDPKTRDEFWKGLFDGGVLALKSGESSIRFRPALDMTADVDRRNNRTDAQIMP